MPGTGSRSPGLWNTDPAQVAVGGRGAKAGRAAEGVGSVFPAPGGTWSVTKRPTLDRGRLRRPPLWTRWHLAAQPRPGASRILWHGGGGAGTGTPRSARLRVRVPCEAWMCSSCRLSPPVSAVLASAVLSRLGRSCLTPLPKPTLPSPPRQRPALLRCALRVIPGTLLTGSVPPRVTACRCLFPACLARLQPFTQVGGEGPGSRPLLEPAQCC